MVKIETLFKEGKISKISELELKYNIILAQNLCMKNILKGLMNFMKMLS